MTKSVVLSDKLTKKLVRHAGALAIKKTVATTMAAAGRAATTDGERAFIESVATLNSDYRMLIHDATKEAQEAGYDPVNHGTLQVYAERGIATWEETDEEKPSESEDGKDAEEQQGKA